MIYLLAGLLLLFIAYIISKKSSSPKQKSQPNQSQISTKIITKSQKQQKKQTSTKLNQSIKSPEPSTKQKKNKPKKVKQQKINEQKVIQNQKINDVNQQLLVGNLKVPGIEAIDIKLSKVLVSSANKQLTLFDLKNFKKDNPAQSKKGYLNLQNNIGSAVAIGQKYYFVALDNQKTIAYYEFIGQNNVYFKFVKKFPKNIHKDIITGLYVDQNEKFIITVGNLADTMIKVWSLNGQKLQQFNTSQVEHYQVKFSNDLIALRSWTPQIKLYQIKVNKQNKQFLKIQKKSQFTHSDGTLNGGVDNQGEFGISIRKDHTVQLWRLQQKSNEARIKKIIDSAKLDISQVTICGIHTIITEQDKKKTMIGLSDGKKIMLCDFQTFGTLAILEKCITGNDTILDFKFVGKKTVLLYTYSKKSGKILIWNLSSLFEKIQGV